MGRTCGRMVVAAAAVALIGLGSAMTSAEPPQPKGNPVHTIELPYEEPPVVPDGPNKAAFTAYCRLCHSPRLVLTQPRLTDKQWTAVVKKMVTTFGAPIPPEEEAPLVAYLTAVRGPEKAAGVK